MGKGTGKKVQERRRSPRSGKTVRETVVEKCVNCSQPLGNSERALLVEEEVGRIFCTESCIGQYFAPEIERLEREYFDRLSPGDLQPEEREKHAHLRWVTLEEPDEVWREKTLAGDLRYTLVSEFKPGAYSIWSVCICLFLRGEPSFLYLAFPTKNAAMVDLYRRGDRIQWTKHDTQNAEGGEAEDSSLIDGLAEEWTEQETRMAEMSAHRKSNDIPLSDFALYQACLEETLEHPDEIWMQPQGPGAPAKEGSEEVEMEGLRTFHFIKRYPEDGGGVWYVVVARETEEEEQIEVLEAFPTRDMELLQRYQRGSRDGAPEDEDSTSSRMIH